MLLTMLHKTNFTTNCTTPPYNNSHIEQLETASTSNNTGSDKIYTNFSPSIWNSNLGNVSILRYFIKPNFQNSRFLRYIFFWHWCVSSTNFGTWSCGYTARKRRVSFLRGKECVAPGDSLFWTLCRTRRIWTSSAVSFGKCDAVGLPLTQNSFKGK